MKVDWIQLFTDHNIYFVTAGPNTGRNEVSVKCPFCGDDDPSQHLSANLITSYWGCWRDLSHRGKSPERLVSALLGVSGAQAKHIIEAYTGAALDDFDTLGAVTEAYKTRTPVTLPDEFEPINERGLTGRFHLYVANRGFDNVDKVVSDYSLKACLVGRWKGRLIIPIFGHLTQRSESLTFNQEVVGSNPTVPTLIGWQGRSIRTVEGVPRYLTSHDEVKRSLYNIQNLTKGGEALFICEGPWDAIKIDYYGKPKIRATCLFGATPTTEQINHLYKLASKFSRVTIGFDTDLVGIRTGFQLSDWLPGAGFASLPEGHKDFDEFTPDEMRRYLYGTENLW